MFYLRLERQKPVRKPENKTSIDQALLKEQIKQLTTRIENKKREIQEREDTIQSYTRLLQVLSLFTQLHFTYTFSFYSFFAAHKLQRFRNQCPKMIVDYTETKNAI